MFKVVGLAALIIMMTGCMSDLTGSTYSREEARHMQVVKFGSITEVRLVKLEGSNSGVGTLAGGAVGGIAAGSSLGGGSGKAIAAIAGAVAGGVLGNMAEKKLTKTQGVEITVKLVDGTFVSVVQQVDPDVTFAQGDRVKIMSQAGGNSRVMKVQQ